MSNNDDKDTRHLVRSVDDVNRYPSLCAFVLAYYDLFEDGDSGAYYAVERDTRRAFQLSAQGGEFASVLDELFVSVCGASLAPAQLDGLLRTLVGHAMRHAQVIGVHLRIAEAGGAVYLEGFEDSGKLVRISGGGFDVVERTALGVPIFRSTRSARPYPTPAPGVEPQEALGLLERFVHVARRDLVLLVGFVVFCLLRERASFPLLVLSAEQGSGKSFAMRVLADLIAPSTNTGGRLPRQERQLAVDAWNMRLLLFDNLSRLSDAQSDMLSRSLTGGTFDSRALYTSHQLDVFLLNCPVIITSIVQLVGAADLADRTLSIRLDPIGADQRQTDRELLAQWGECRTRVFSGMLALAARVQQLLASGMPRPERLPRLADFGMVLAAIDRVLDTHSLDDYLAKKAVSDTETISDEPLVLALQQAARTGKIPTQWRGVARRILDRLTPIFQGEIELATSKQPPKSARELTRSLTKCAPGLRQMGWTISGEEKATGKDSGSTVWTIIPPGNAKSLMAEEALDEWEESLAEHRHAKTTEEDAAKVLSEQLKHIAARDPDFMKSLKKAMADYTPHDESPFVQLDGDWNPVITPAASTKEPTQKD